ncbi:MAG: patatin-like phospholipase family protein [Egibacteraceae bacterium]
MADAPRRSLIMAGGGVKVAFQAGVLQVWLDEAGLVFDHADSASGGVFNLAMWCQGMSGTEMADHWRRYRPLRAVQPTVAGLLAAPLAGSLLSYRRFRRTILRDWGLNWTAIRATDRAATFNLYDFTAHEHVVRPAADMTEDLLISAVSLPIWFPPVRVDGHHYIDAVFATDANLEEGIRRGADELWVVWTVSEQGRWRRGFVHQYFQIIEAAANSRLRADLARIQRSNAAVAAGEHGEFGRPVAVRLLRAEVPVHYLLTLTRDRMAAAVDLGVHAARDWCAEQGIALRAPAATAAAPAPPAAPTADPQRRGVRFTEEMTGFVTLGDDDPDRGARTGRAAGTRAGFRLTIAVDDLDRFVTDPDLAATATGEVRCEVLGGRLPVERGAFNLFVDADDPRDKRMRYRLWFRDAAGHPLTLTGFKVVRDDPGPDAWADTTTLYTRILRGHVDGPATEAADVVAAGILRIRPLAFARQLTTFRATAPTRRAGLAALARFGRLFAGNLRDVYAGPVGRRAPTP